MADKPAPTDAVWFMSEEGSETEYKFGVDYGDPEDG